MSILETIANNLKVLHKVTSVPTEDSKMGIHLVEGGGVYLVVNDPILPETKMVKKVFDRSDHYLKGDTDTLLQNQKDLLDATDQYLQTQVNNLQNINTKKAYLTKSDADADTNPLGDDGNAIGLGQLVVVTSDTTTSLNGMYRLKLLTSGVPTWEYVGVIGDVTQKADHGYTSTPKSLKQVEDEKASDIAQLAVDVRKSLQSNELLHLVNENQMDPSTWVSYLGGTIDRTGNVVILANGVQAKLIIPSEVTIGNKYIMITNISNIDWINEEVVSLDFFNYSQLLPSLKIAKGDGSVKDYFNYSVFTASSTGIIQVFVSGANVNDSNIVPIGTELISFNAGIIGIAEWSQELEDLLATAKTRYVGGKVLPITALKSLSDKDYQLPESSFKTFSDLVSRTKEKYTPGILRWDNTPNATNITNEVVEQEVGGEILPVWRVGGTLDLTTYPGGRLWFGFDIMPENYALEEKTYIVILQGKVTANNINNFLYITATGDTIELAQDLADGVETSIKAMGQFIYSAGSTSNKRYTYLYYYRRDSNIAEISYLAEFTTCSIFEPIEGFTIDDYILAAKQGIIKPIYSPQGEVTKTYVDNSITTALGNVSKLSPNDLTPIFDIEMFASGGQSLNVGGGAADSTTDWKNIPTFALGNSLYSRAFTTPAEKDAFFGDGFILMEDNITNEQYPPVTASINTILSLLSEENKIDVSNFGYQMMPFTWGVSGNSIIFMEKGTTAYNNFMECITKAKEFANKEGKTFGVRSMNWYHGEADRGQTYYYDKMSQLFIDIDTDVKLITGQTEDVQFFTYQTSPWLGVDIGSGPIPTMNIQEAQIQVVRDFPNVHLCGAMYQFAYADFYHPIDRAVVGLQTGVAMKRVLHDGETWNDFIPLSHQVINDGTNYYIHLKFGVPSKPMRFDVSADAWHNPNGKQPNFGFKVLSAGIEQQIAEPFIVKGDTVVLTVGSNPTGMTIQYAVDGHYGGGNLCDSQNIIIRNKGIDYVIDNFAAGFSEYIV